VNRFSFLSALFCTDQFRERPVTPPSEAAPYLPADNIWNTPVDQLPISSNTSTYVNHHRSTIGVHADFGSGVWDGGPIGIPVHHGSRDTDEVFGDVPVRRRERTPGPYAVPLNAPIEGGSQSTRRPPCDLGSTSTIASSMNSTVRSRRPPVGTPARERFSICSRTPFALHRGTSADAAGLPIVPGLAR